MWEKKSMDGSLDDVDDVNNTLHWSASVGGTAADGTLFTTFLPGPKTPPAVQLVTVPPALRRSGRSSTP
jgi:hypothetical protein